MTSKRLSRAVLLALPLLVAACSDLRAPLLPGAQRSEETGIAADPAQAIHGVIDDFAGTVIDTDRWSLVGPEAWLTQDDRLIVTLPPNVADHAGLRFRLPADFTGRSLSAEISQIITGSATAETYLSVITLDAEEFVVVSSLGGNLTAWYKERGKSFRQLGSSISFNPVNHRFRRIREQSGTLFVETSANGQSWTRPSGWSVPSFFTDPTALYGNLGARERGTGNGNPTPAIFENVNTAVPAIPSGLAAAAVSSTQISLSWQDRSVNESGFRIERRVAGGSFAQVAVTGANATTYQDAALQPQTTYEYRVRAFNGSGESGYTRTASATTQPPAGPSPPDLHTLVDDFAGTVIRTADWAFYHDPSRAHQSDRVVVTLTPNVAGYGGLMSARPHRFVNTALTVEISQVAGGGPLTETFIGVTTPDEGEYVVISSLGGNIGAYAKWRGESWFRYRLGAEVPYDPAAHRFRRIREQGGRVYFELSADGITWTQPPGWSVAHAFTDVNGLHAALGAGAFTADPNAGTAVFENVNTTVPAIPSQLVAAASSASQIALSWQDRSVNESGFRIERRVAGGSFAEIATSGPNIAAYQDTGLQAATTYEYRVRAFNGSGNSGYTNTASATTPSSPPPPPPPPPPAAPSGLRASTQSASRVDLNWVRNSTDEAGFEVQRSTAAGTWSTIASTGPGATAYSDMGLQEATSYSYRVRAFNASGSSAWSDTASATTLPAAPAGLTATALSSSRIDLSWTDNSSGEQGYDVYRATAGGESILAARLGANVTAYSDTGLPAGTSFTYRVRAFNAAGNSAWSNEASARTHDPVPPPPPPPPPGFMLEAVGYRERGLQVADLTWSGTDAQRIDIYRDGQRVATVNNTGSYTDRIGGRGSGSYVYRVCGAGSDTCSNLATVVF